MAGTLAEKVWDAHLVRPVRAASHQMRVPDLLRQCADHVLLLVVSCRIVGGARGSARELTQVGTCVSACETAISTYGQL